MLPKTMQSEQIKIVVNGEERLVPAGQNIPEILTALGVEAGRVAIEMNRAIVRKPDWDSTAVHEGAALEIVQFVGGG